MKIFIDSARLDEISEVKSYGVLDGVTTNPSLIKKAVDNLKKQGKKIDIKTYIKQILRVVGKGKSVSLEVIGTDYKSMVREGLLLYKIFNPIAKNVYVKIPVNPEMKINGVRNAEGLRAIKYLSEKGIPINCTLVFTPEQALMAAKAGASFVSPFAGRVDDYIRKKEGIKFEKTDYFPSKGEYKKGRLIEDNGVVSGVHLISEITDIFRNYNFQCKVLAASLRSARQIRECALVGADIVTAPLSAIKNTLMHEKTIEGMKGFVKDIVPEYSSLFRVKIN